MDTHQGDGSAAPERDGGSLGRPFWTLASSSGLSNLADGIFKTALPLVAVRYTRSPALIASLELVRSLPWLLLALQAGAVADRHDRRRLMVGANAARAAMVVIPAVAIGLGHGSLEVLFVAAVGTGVAEVFYDTSAQSILPSLVPRRLLGRANARLGAVELGGQQFAGPPVAGALVAASAALALWLPGAMWIVAVAALAMLRGTFRPPRRDGGRTTIRHDVAEGVRFLRSHALLRRLAVMVGVVNLATAASGTILVLFIVGEGSAMELTETGFGILIAVTAAGSLLGSVICEPLERLVGRARVLHVSIITMIVFVGGPAASANIVWIPAIFLLGGAGVMLWNIPTVSFRQAVTPDHLLGRVNSAYRLVAWGTLPVGAALGGALGEWLGLRPVFAIMGGVAASLLILGRPITDVALARAERTER